MVSGSEIARRAGGKKRYRENPSWAIQPLLRLAESAAIETDFNNHYRINPTGKTDNQQSTSAPVSPSVAPHWSVRKKPAAPDVRTGKKILYVDDDKQWREVVGTFLQHLGYEILTAGDATEAMRLGEGVKLSLIILDLDLAGEDGLMLMKFFKHNQPEVPIILYTDLSHDEEEIRAMLQQGAHQYVRKGLLADLRKVVQAAVS